MFNKLIIPFVSIVLTLVTSCGGDSSNSVPTPTETGS